MSKEQDNTKQPPQSVKIRMRFFDFNGENKQLQYITEVTLISSQLPFNHVLGGVTYKIRGILRDEVSGTLCANYTPRVLPMRPVQRGRIVDKCSRCRIKRKSPRSLPVANPFDQWCDRCYIYTPLVLRSRKTSRAELKKLEARQKLAKAAIAARRAEKLAKQEAAKAAGKTTGKTPAKTKSKSAVGGSDDSLHYEFAAARDGLIYEDESTD